MTLSRPWAAVLVALLLVVPACRREQAPPFSLPPIPEEFSPDRRPSPPQPLDPASASCRVMVGRGTGARVVGRGEGSDGGSLREGDVVVAAGGVTVADAGALVDEVRSHEVGETMVLSVRRDGARLQLEVVLAESPSEPGRPVIGVLVRTVYEEREPGELAERRLDGQFVRAAVLEDSLFLLDPLTGAWSPLGEDRPAGPWTTAAGDVLELAADGDALLPSGEEPVPLDTEDWRPSRLLAGVDGIVIAAAGRPVDESREEAGVIGVDRRSGELLWEWVPTPLADDPPASDMVVAASLDGLANPSRSLVLVRFLVGGAAQEISYAVLDPSGAERSGWGGPDPRVPAPGTFVHGWYDDGRLVYSHLGGEREGLFAYDSGTGSSDPLSVPVDPGPVTRLWPVGDGRHVLTLGERGLLSLDLSGESETRPLAEGCRVELADPGWGA